MGGGVPSGNLGFLDGLGAVFRFLDSNLDMGIRDFVAYKVNIGDLRADK